MGEAVGLSGKGERDKGGGITIAVDFNKSYHLSIRLIGHHILSSGVVLAGCFLGWHLAVYDMNVSIFVVCVMECIHYIHRQGLSLGCLANELGVTIPAAVWGSS